jgi:hypothetical protein
MDRKKATQLAAILGLITGALALGTAAFTFMHQLQEQKDQIFAQSRRLEDNRRLLEQQRQLYEQQKEADLRAQQAAQALAEQARICEGHQANRLVIEQRFGQLMASHGTLMNSLKVCMETSEDDGQGTCFATVCAAAYIFTNGESNCLDTAATASAIKTDLDRENAASRADECVIPSSAVTEYFGGQ